MPHRVVGRLANLAAFTKIKVLAGLADEPLATYRLLTAPIAAVALVHRYLRAQPDPQERMPTWVVPWRHITAVRTEIIILTVLAFVPNAHLNRLVASITADSIGVQRRAR